MTLSRRELFPLLAGLAALPALASRPAAATRGADGDAPPTPAAFLDAVVRGELPAVRAALQRRPELAAARDAAGRSACVLAAVHGHAEVVGALLATGLEPDLVEAVLVEDWPRFETLAARDPAALHAAHPVGGTPLYAAALVGSTDMWRLRSAGCLSDAAPDGGSGFTPARGALRSVRPEWAHSALCDLLGNGGDANAPQRGGSSVLHGAVQRRDARLVRLALRKGADAAAVDDAGRTPRALAVELGWIAGARLLADPDALPRDHRASRWALDAERRPIERADLSDVPRAAQSAVTGASHFNLAAVREHLARDPRLVFSVSADDELAIEAAAHIGQRDIMRLHLDHGAPLSLPTAVSLGDTDSVRFWLERDPRLAHERGAHDFPVMWYAVLGGGSVAMAELLAAHGVGVDQESRGATALHWCVRRGDHDLARWLLERGADPEPASFAWNRARETPLALARAAGDTTMVGILEHGGARR